MSVSLWILVAVVPIVIGAIIALIAVVAISHRRSTTSLPASPDLADSALERERLAARAAAQRAVAQGIAGQQRRSDNQLF